MRGVGTIFGPRGKKRKRSMREKGRFSKVDEVLKERRMRNMNQK